MPALDPISELSGIELEEFQRSRVEASRVASSIPLVRVTVPWDSTRAKVEMDDMLRYGLLKRSHKSEAAREKEIKLEASDCLYFHAGRLHPAYGKMVVVITDLSCLIEATPFGIGALACDGSVDGHKSCLDPVAHRPLTNQRLFLEQSTWKNDWREKTAEFIALYYCPNPDRYFKEWPLGHPLRNDPDGIYADGKNTDWRLGTVEVRALQDVDLFAVLRGSALQMWSTLSHVREDIDNEVQQLGIPIEELYPFYASLPRNIEFVASDLSLFQELQEKITRTVLA